MNCESLSSLVKAAEEFLATLDKLFVEGNYLSEQIFSMDETSLSWQRWLQRLLSIGRSNPMPGCKAIKDRIIVSLGGCYRIQMKLFMIWYFHSRAFKHINKHTLPVCYSSNNALLNCYASEMEKYYLEKNIFSKILLIVGNGPRHPFSVGTLSQYQNVLSPFKHHLFDWANGWRIYSNFKAN